MLSTRAEYRQLQRNGRCSCCYRTIVRNKGEVVTFWGKQERVVICMLCLEEIEKLIVLTGATISA